MLAFLYKALLEYLDNISAILSGSLSKSGPLNFGTKNNFPSFFVREKGLAHVYKKQFIILQFLIFALLRAKVADRDQKGKIHRFCEACYVP